MHTGATTDHSNWELTTQYACLLTQYGSNEDNYLSLLSNGAQLCQLVSMEWFEDSLLTQCIQLVEASNSINGSVSAPTASSSVKKTTSVLSNRSQNSLNTLNTNCNNRVGNNTNTNDKYTGDKENSKGIDKFNTIIPGKNSQGVKSGTFLNSSYYNEYCNYINDNHVIITAFPTVLGKNI